MDSLARADKKYLKKTIETESWSSVIQYSPFKFPKGEKQFPSDKMLYWCTKLQTENIFPAFHDTLLIIFWGNCTFEHQNKTMRRLQWNVMTDDPASVSLFNNIKLKNSSKYSI